MVLSRVPDGRDRPIAVIARVDASTWPKRFEDAVITDLGHRPTIRWQELATEAAKARWAKSASA